MELNNNSDEADKANVLTIGSHSFELPRGCLVGQRGADLSKKRQGLNLAMDENVISDVLDSPLCWPTKTLPIGRPVIYPLRTLVGPRPEGR